MVDKEVVSTILDMIPTMEEGIEYIETQLKGLNIEATQGVLVDLIDAFGSIEQAMYPMLDEFGENKVEENTEELKHRFHLVVQEYEKENGQNVLHLIQESLKPVFQTWKNEVEAVLRPYVTH